MAKGKKVRLRLAKDHVWTSSPGYQIVVVDRGAARVDIPVGWHLDFVETGLEVRNFPKPDDTCLIQITVLPMPNEMDWRTLPLVPLFKNAMEHGGSEVLRRGPIVEVKREGLAGVWQETRFIDPELHKEAASFCILARERGIHVFITLSCWPEGVPEFLPVWDEILRSLRIGEYVDATTGRRIRPREN